MISHDEMMKFVSSKTKSAKSSGDGVPTGDLMSSCDPRALPGGFGVASVSKEISKTVKKEKSFSSSRVTAIGNKLPSDYGSGISNRTKQKKLPIKSILHCGPINNCYLIYGISMADEICPVIVIVTIVTVQIVTKLPRSRLR